jgi:endogenous inhibitor of DNA gyrase (YacG/DUF329 family)
MRNPKTKTIHKLTPEIITKLFSQAIRMEYQGKVYGEYGPCPRCGNEKSWAYDKKKKIFCKLITEGGFEDITITLVTRECSRCRKVFYPKSPYYPGCSYGKPLIDFILFLAAKNPYNRVENILLNFGIQVDRDSVKNYAKKFKDRITRLVGMKMFDEDIGINLLKLFFNVNNVKELKKKYPHLKGIESASDETYPAKKGAKKALREENKTRKLLGEGEKKYPDGFTLAVSYLPTIKSYASLIVTENSFNSLFSRLLRLPLIGSDYNLTDGHRSYNDYPDHEKCLVHKARNESKKDKVLKRLKESALPKDIKEYLHQKYLEMKEEMLRMLKEKYPNFVDSQRNFIGSITTNSIEGGNWRIKFELRTSYSNINSITGRSILITIMDSMYNFRYGKPNESFVHANSSFRFEDVMSIIVEKEKKMRFQLPKLEFNPLSVRNMKW